MSSGREVQGKSLTVGPVSPWGQFCLLLEKNHFSGRGAPRVCLKLAQKRVKGRELRHERKQLFEISNKGRQGHRMVCKALNTMPSTWKGLNACWPKKGGSWGVLGECRPPECMLTKGDVSTGLVRKGFLESFLFSPK